MGAPLKFTDIGAEPARLLHIDFDAVRDTYVGKYFLYQLDKLEMWLLAIWWLSSLFLASICGGLTA